MYVDLSSLQCIRDFVKQFQEKENKLNILINNAGNQDLAMSYLISSFIYTDIWKISR